MLIFINDLLIAGAVAGQPVLKGPGHRPGKLPTIIAIMNESMTDFSRVGGMSFTPDNLPFIHSLEASGQIVWGTAYSSVYGGNDVCEKACHNACQL